MFYPQATLSLDAGIACLASTGNPSESPHKTHAGQFNKVSYRNIS